MYQSIGIYYFSGTGNTMAIAELLMNGFKTKGITTVNLIKIEDITKDKVILEPINYDLIGILHPIYGLKTPQIVYDFIKKLPLLNGKKVFVVKTGGDFHQLNFASSKGWMKKLVKKGYEIVYEALLAMPSNWLIKYDDLFSKKLYEAAQKKSLTIVKELLEGSIKILQATLFTSFLANVVGFVEEKMGARFFGKSLKTNKSCILCNKCVNNCPRGNITNNKNRIKFGWRCIWCMRCIYACPQHAITSFPNIFTLKGGYNIQVIIHNDALKGDFLNGKEKGYYAHFHDYLNSD